MSLTTTNTILEAVLVIQGNSLTIENPDNAIGMIHTCTCTYMYSGLETASHAGHHRSTNLVNVQLKLNCIQSIYGQDIKSSDNRSKYLAVSSIFPHPCICT